MTASWYDWQLGGSFGHRAFTETLAVFAIPLAACLEAVAHRPLILRLTVIAASLAIALSTLQMLQYWLNILPISDITWAQYRSLFLRF